MRGIHLRAVFLTYFSHLSHEPIATAGNSLDIRMHEIFAERFAKEGNHFREADFFYDSVWPDFVEQFLLVNDPTTVFDEHKQSFEGLWGQGHQAPLAQESALVRIQSEHAEFIKMFGWKVHSIPSGDVKYPFKTFSTFGIERSYRFKTSSKLFQGPSKTCFLTYIQNADKASLESYFSFARA